MGALFGGGKTDDGGAAARLAEQERKTKLAEQQQAAQLQAHRRSMGSGNRSKTIFEAVSGIGDATAKRVKLGE